MIKSASEIGRVNKPSISPFKNGLILGFCWIGKRRSDIRHNDTQHKDTERNDIQFNNTEKKRYIPHNGTAHSRKCKQLLEYLHLLLLRGIWCSKLLYIYIYISMYFIFSPPVLIRHPWQLKTVVFMHWYLIRTVLLN